MGTVVYMVFMIMGLYLLAGAVFAIFFLTKGITKMDSGAHGSSWGFRLIILPGTIVLWPVLFNRWMKVKKVSHDKAAS
ncbi:MAG: hypothetical protein ABI666_09650 [Ferruginibacter sp.]